MQRKPELKWMDVNRESWFSGPVMSRCKTRKQEFIMLWKICWFVLVTLFCPLPAELFVLADEPTASEPEGWRNVKHFGALGDSKADDTDAIQRAIDIAKAKGGTIYLPPGTYRVRSLNLTHCGGIVLRGAGAGYRGSTLQATESGVNVLDLTGSYHFNLENFWISTTSENVVPRTAILMAQVSGGPSNAFHFENLFVTGHFSLATVYDFGCPSSDMLNCDFYNFYPGGEAVVMAFTRNNYAGVTSAFTEVDKPSQEKGYLNTSDWTLTACELHDLSTQRNKGQRSKLTALRLDQTMQMRWVGGNISGEGDKLIHFTGHNHHITFVGTTLYSEVGFAVGSIFHNSGRLDGFSVNECQLQAAIAVFSGDPNAVFDEIHFHSKPTSSMPGNAWLLKCQGGKLRNSIIHCDGLGLEAESIETTLLINPGQIIATSDSSMKVK